MDRLDQIRLRGRWRGVVIEGGDDELGVVLAVGDDQDFQGRPDLERDVSPVVILRGPGYL